MRRKARGAWQRGDECARDGQTPSLSKSPQQRIASTNKHAYYTHSAPQFKLGCHRAEKSVRNGPKNNVEKPYVSLTLVATMYLVDGCGGGWRRGGEGGTVSITAHSSQILVAFAYFPISVCCAPRYTRTGGAVFDGVHNGSHLRQRRPLHQWSRIVRVGCYSAVVSFFSRNTVNTKFNPQTR